MAERIAEVKKQIAASLAAKREAHAQKRAAPAPAPRYDEVFAEGVKWLDSLT